MSVDIIDLNSGNVKSIQNVLSSLNVYSRLVDKPSDIKSRIVILPGVGSAKPYMEKLQQSGFDKALKKHVQDDQVLIGICLGFQLMTQYTEEDGGVEGLGLIDATVERLKSNHQEVNHNGWDEFNIKKEQLTSVGYVPKYKLTRKQIISGRVFYNHEYGVKASDKLGHVNLPIHSVRESSTGESRSGASLDLSKYSAMYISSNVVGMQFHPEKSQVTGMNLLSLLL